MHVVGNGAAAGGRCKSSPMKQLKVCLAVRSFSGHLEEDINDGANIYFPTTTLHTIPLFSIGPWNNWTDKAAAAAKHKRRGQINKRRR